MSVFTFELKSQEIYSVNTSTLNVRNGAGKEYKVIGKLKDREEVIVYETKGDWAKIYLYNDEAYINKRFLVLKRDSNIVSKKQEDKTDNIWFYFIIAFVIFISYYRYKRKCDICKKWNSMVKIKTVKIGEKQSNIKKTETHTDLKGKKHFNTYYVPATINYFDIHRQCKHCGYRDIIEKSHKIEN